MTDFRLSTCSLVVVLACGTTFAPASDGPLSARERTRLESELERRLADAEQLVEREPDSVASYSARGDAHFFLGRFDEALRDYERMVRIDPKQGASHWRRGIARFYAGKYADAAEQFEEYHTFDDVDRENGIWRYLSQRRAHGVEKARRGLLRYEKTDREPFPDVYRLFAGTIEPEAILKRIDEADVDERAKSARRFYAHLYIGLNHAVEKREERAREHLAKAVAVEWPRTAGYGPNYMWHVARLHHAALSAKNARNE